MTTNVPLYSIGSPFRGKFVRQRTLFNHGSCISGNKVVNQLAIVLSFSFRRSLGGNRPGKERPQFDPVEAHKADLAKRNPNNPYLGMVHENYRDEFRRREFEALGIFESKKRSGVHKSNANLDENRETKGFLYFLVTALVAYMFNLVLNDPKCMAEREDEIRIFMERENHTKESNTHTSVPDKSRNKSKDSLK